MASFKSLFKIWHSIFPVADFLYILQLEEYSSKRLIRWMPRFFWRRNFQIREHLKYTKRVTLTIILIVILWLSSFTLTTLLLQNEFAILLTLPVWLIVTPVFVLIGNVLISPYFEYIKSNIRRQAKSKISQMPNLKIVAVAGSYGKTTVKNFIYQLVRYTYRTQMIPGNINTPAGIAAWVNQHLKSNTELLIAEVDAYTVGEIAKSCEVVPADVAVLTNVGDQHLERFGNQQVLAAALSEVFTNSKHNAYLITTQDTKNKLPIHVDKREWVIVEPLPDAHPTLSASNQINLQFALTAARLLNVPEKFIQDSITNLELPERRQRLTEMYSYQAIDDSYNISFTTAQAGISTAKAEANKSGKHLLVITAGIPELSQENRDKNHKLGEILSTQADHIVVLSSMFADEIISGISNPNKCTKVADLNTFLTTTRYQFPPSEWFLLMQPELGDLYY